MNPPILVLRPEPGATATAARIRAGGAAALVLPLFETVARDWTGPEPGAIDALLVTSAATLRHGGAGLAAYRGLPLVAVGAATAAAARAAGFARVEAAGGDAAAAVALLERMGARTVFHPGGRQRTAVATGLRLIGATVYEAVALPPPPALARPPAGAVALVHSARAGAALAAAVADRGALSVAAISDAALEAAGGGWARAAAAERPDDAALVALGIALVRGRTTVR